MNIIAHLQAAFAPALAELTPDPAAYLGMFRAAQDARHGDYQLNCAMALGKKLSKKPQEVAADLLARLPASDIFEPPTVAGPGFINIKLKSEWLAEQVQAVAAHPRLGVEPVSTPRRYVVDYSGPNVAKPLHVGHLRSTIIGESVCRILRYLGHEVVGDNHLGDWGTQFGMLIYGYKHFLSPEQYKADPVRELARLYVHIRTLTKGQTDEEGCETLTPDQQALVTAYREETAKLHAGDPENVAIWRQFMPHCIEEIESIYKRLDIHFNEMLGESFYRDMMPGVVADLLVKGVAQESEGAVIVALDEQGRRVALIQKRDGAYTYMTSDLATIQYRANEWHPDAMLYVVDFRQADHFKLLFETARRWGYDSTEFAHLQFGSVLDSDGKPFAARKGGAPDLEHLLDEAVRKGAEKYEEIRQGRIERGETVPELGVEEKQHIAEVVGIGAVKYADLCQNRSSNYKFDWAKMLATDGNTATYMQYAYARCRAIFRKENIDSTPYRNAPPAVIITHPLERALTVLIVRYEEVLRLATCEYLPHYISDYLYVLAKTLSSFYEACPVLKAESPELRASRLLIVDLASRIIERMLYLLGIRVLEQM